MKTCCASVLCCVLLAPLAAFGQDPLKVDPSHYKLIMENATVRVLRISYPPGDKSTMHQHPDAIVVPLVDSNVRFAMPDGKSQDNNLTKEMAMYTPAATHMPHNVGKGAVDAILVEFKSAKPGTAALPTTRPNMAMKVLAESPRATAYRMTADATFQEPAGSKHDYDQLVIALGDTPISLSIDGKPAKTRWARGDVQFIGRGVGHESKNAGGKPVDFVIIAIK